MAKLKIDSPSLLLLLAFLIVASGPELKADVTGSILGAVTDAGGGVLPGVEVVATNLETNQRQSTRTDNLGQYRILAMPVGTYKVEASAPGFQKFLETGIDLTVNQQHRVDIVLQVGNVEQQVEVNAAALQVETTATQLGDVVEEKKMLALPLNGRSYIDLLGLQAGVAPASAGTITQDRPVSGGLNAGNISVNGAREAANAFLVNGGDVTEGRNMGTAIIPNIDSVAEFRLKTHSFDAEYGRFSGAVMNAITKSGTNGFHGTAFEFLRNNDLDARNFSIRGGARSSAISSVTRWADRPSRTRYSGSPIIRARARLAASRPACFSFLPSPSGPESFPLATSSITQASPPPSTVPIGPKCCRAAWDTQ
jgi:hypothetical protein